MASSDAYAMEWIQKEKIVPVVNQARGTVHPKDLVSVKAKKWSDVWAPPNLVKPLPENYEQFLDWIPQGGFAFRCDWEVTAEQLRGRYRASKRSSASMDGWCFLHFCLLPDGAFEDLAVLLNSFVRTRANLPELWKHLRVVMIPKANEPIEKRPISVAACLWRLLAASILQNIDSWVRSWLPPQIAGGVKRLDVDDIHAVLHEDLQSGGFAAGGKMDLNKCFDRVDAVSAVSVLQRLGLPAEICDLISSFYTEQKAWISDVLCIHTQPVERTNGLLQGCPFSVFLFTGVMSCYAVFLGKHCPEVKVAVYVDDRLLLITGVEALPKPEEAFRLTKLFDDAFCFLWKAGKGSTFAITAGARERLAVSCNQVGESKVDVTFLGIDYCVEQDVGDDALLMERDACMSKCLGQL